MHRSSSRAVPTASPIFATLASGLDAGEPRRETAPPVARDPRSGSAAPASSPIFDQLATRRIARGRRALSV